MGWIGLAITVVCYIIAAYEFYRKGNYGTCVAFIAYAIANAGFIYELVKNWDKERIALSDLIIMRMAITEITYIKDIPHKVTLDEYIEISKEYSTPKSNEFINGVLDVFIKDILSKKSKNLNI